jgi:hypothetical protein
MSSFNLILSRTLIAGNYLGKVILRCYKWKENKVEPLTKVVDVLMGYWERKEKKMKLNMCMTYCLIKKCSGQM